MIVVVSPEHEDARELPVLLALFAAGLERYHVRKPSWPAGRLQAWLERVPAAWRPRLVLHHHHELCDTLGLGGRHWPEATAPVRPPAGPLRSRSCHDLAGLRASLGAYDSVFFGPVFESISKPGHGPRPDLSLDQLSRVLRSRPRDDRRTLVLALGGVTVARLPALRALGFDGAAVLGAIWQAEDPVAAFADIERADEEGAATPLPPVAQGRPLPLEGSHA